MHSHGRIPVASIVAVMALVLMTASGVTSAQAPQAGLGALPAPGFTVRVALLAPFQGDLSAFGEGIRNGVDLAVQAMAPDWDVEIVEWNTECSGDLAVAAATEVISAGIHYIIGDVCTGSSRPVSELAEDSGVLMISPTASGQDVTAWSDGENKEYVFRAIVTDASQGETMATLSAGIGSRRAAVMMNADNPRSIEQTQVFAAHLQALGGVISPTVLYTMGAYAEAMAEVKAAAPEAVFMPEYVPDANSLLSEARSQGIDVPFLGSDSWDSLDLDMSAAEGCYFPTPFLPNDPRPVVADFVAGYAAAYGQLPDVFAAHGYDAMALFLLAVAEAQDDDAAAVRDALVGLAYEGVTGRMTFNSIGDPLKTVPVMTVENGQQRLYRHVAPQESRSLASGTVLTTTDQIVALEMPATITHTLTVTYTPQLTPTKATGYLAFGGVSFRLQATDEEGNQIIEFTDPLTLTVSYIEADLAPGTDESTVEVLRWDVDTQDWVALEVVSRDTEANTITVLLDHLSEFALLARVRRALYVPLLRR